MGPTCSSVNMSCLSFARPFDTCMPFTSPPGLSLISCIGLMWMMDKQSQEILKDQPFHPFAQNRNFTVRYSRLGSQFCQKISSEVHEYGRVSDKIAELKKSGDPNDDPSVEKSLPFLLYSDQFLNKRI
ncbi:hypothetical protein mRhiFer1_009743 [Rhinolophus ferrumequinum]|uniref:Uncharacterized protein n=1 Tax=Rhinolophus ferrumequinum TaxID=59479 RepID=A0A7J7ZCZ3_RHIFE|nr:hypothetical protein mRhiFer1_009743 [Rhinolophus ferrumequinum]